MLIKLFILDLCSVCLLLNNATLLLFNSSICNNLHLELYLLGDIVKEYFV